MHSDVSMKVKKKHFIKHLCFSYSFQVVRLIDLFKRRSAGDAKQPWAWLGAVHIWSNRTMSPWPNQTPLVFDLNQFAPWIDSDQLFPALITRLVPRTHLVTVQQIDW